MDDNSWMLSLVVQDLLLEPMETPDADTEDEEMIVDTGPKNPRDSSSQGSSCMLNFNDLKFSDLKGCLKDGGTRRMFFGSITVVLIAILFASR